MGRAGGGGGGHSSGGGHSHSRSGGGHRTGSSSGGSRARGGGFSGGPGGGFGGGPRGGGFGGGPGSGPRRTGGPGMPPPPPRHYGGPGMPPPPRHHRGYYGGYGRMRRVGCSTTLVAMIFIFIVIAYIISGTSRTAYYGGASSGNQASTIQREKLESGNAYMNNCVVDEIDWFDNVSKTESQLKEFWEETGVQPYIILKDYDAALATDAQKEQWTLDYYDANFDTENIFLYVYFAEEDVDTDVGYMCYANGRQTSSVMDSEAVEIFWNNIDKYWYTDLSTDDVFVNAFNDTADTIMRVSTTKEDVTVWGIALSIVIIAGIVIIVAIKQKNQRAREKAAEDERILNTPMEELRNDDLTKKYQ